MVVNNNNNKRKSIDRDKILDGKLLERRALKLYEWGTQITSLKVDFVYLLEFLIKQRR